jgi:hypothetical protein
LFESRSQQGRELGLIDLRGRDIDRDFGRERALAPQRRLGTGLPDHPGVELLPQSNRLRDAQECAGQNEAVARAAPAYERFEAGAAVVAQIDAGLIEQLEFVPLERRAQVALEAASL